MKLKTIALSILKPIAALLVFVVAAQAVAVQAGATQAVAVQAIQFDDYYSDPVVRTALSMGVQSGALTKANAAQIYTALDFDKADQRKPIPPELAATWAELLRLAQIQTFLRTAVPHYFAVGVEIESSSPKENAWSHFDNGASEVSKLIAARFGQNSLTYKVDPNTEDRFLEFRDELNREWAMKLEWVRDAEGALFPSGWETNTPPFFNLDDMELFSSFLLSLGKSSYGQIADFCGIHQNFDILPQGATDSEKADQKLQARIVANFILLHEQFLPTILETLKITRYGGYDNVFMRPYLFDHQDFLKEIMATPASALSTDSIQNLQQKYLRQEFEAQIANHVDDPAARVKYEKNWQEYKMNWKARDVRIKWHKNTARTILESRSMDYKPADPSVVMKGHLIMQLLLNRAYALAKHGRLHKLDVPWRQTGENVAQYWSRLKNAPSTNMSAMLKGLGVKDENLAAVIEDRPFHTTKKFVAGSTFSFGFEAEFISPKIAKLLVPNLPELRSTWVHLNEEQRLRILKDLGFNFDGEYTSQKYMILSSFFRLDIEHFPQMEIRPHLEQSGRLEVMSNGRGLQTTEDLRAAMGKLHSVLTEDPENNKNSARISYHIHEFVPQMYIDRLTVTEKKKLVRLIERLSLYMNLADYAEQDSAKPKHYIDSWSLDRYSPRDLAEIEAHLISGKGLSNTDQKYHNLGFRPVDGGIDFEFRANGNDIEYGIMLTNVLRNAIENREFENFGALDQPLFFMEPQHYSSPSDYSAFTLSGALKSAERSAAAMPLTKQQLAIAHKLQFEIYKPSLWDYMYMPRGNSMHEAPPEDLDITHLRANYESNIALPLQDWQAQTFLSADEKKAIAVARQKYLSKIEALIKRIEATPADQFILEAKDFLSLCDYLERSTHSSKPNLLKGPEADRQREVLENLVYEIRSYAVEFVKETKIDELVLRSLTKKTSQSDGTNCSELLKATSESGHKSLGH